jgi:type II secretory pathway pseudopilin PulG
MRKQRGVSITGLLIGLIIFVIVAVFAMKVVPSFIEFRAAKAAIEAIARTAQSPIDVRRAWEGRSAIDDIDTVKASDLEISKDGNQMVIAFAYRKEVPLFGKVGLYIDYAASSKGD